MDCTVIQAPTTKELYAVYQGRIFHLPPNHGLIDDFLESAPYCPTCGLVNPLKQIELSTCYECHAQVDHFIMAPSLGINNTRFLKNEFKAMKRPQIFDQLHYTFLLEELSETDVNLFYTFFLKEGLNETTPTTGLSGRSFYLSTTLYALKNFLNYGINSTLPRINDVDSYHYIIMRALHDEDVLLG